MLQSTPTNNQSIQPISHLVEDVFDGPRQVTFQRDGLAYIQLGGLQVGEVYPDSAKQVDPLGMDPRFILRCGDVLLSKTGEAPRAALVSTEFADATFSPDIYCLRLKSGPVSPTWLTYYLNSGLIREKLAERVHGKTTPRLHLADLKHFPVTLPTVELAREVDQLEEQAQQHIQAAREIWISTLRGLYAEIDGRLGIVAREAGTAPGYISSSSSANLFDDGLLDLLERRHEGLSISPLHQIAKIAVSSRKNFDPDQIVQYVQASDIDPHSFLFRNVRCGKVKDLPARIRLPIQAYQVLMLASGSNLGTSNHLVGIVEPQLDGCLASNTFLALEFDETPLYYGMALKHPVVLAQIHRVAVGEVVSTLRKRDVAQLKIPVLGQVWRQDFNDRAQIAWERRSIAKQLRSQAAQLVDAFLRQAVTEPFT